ncbi:hypothetical protein DL89DRAFT_86071 [Linderina pennispora]|uniref:Uncharacterized protein n=1 Tax=Linderina pennispora TaxID=61395 RepID=A0A1Y1WHG4_9FUNG|nr:uncharacterized protein DL89DRAFT_86071 [Linderina pennispora]ORX73011.1 hypothetical protein DL89DRAFT_86071 [Linderina pennispora]
MPREIHLCNILPFLISAFTATAPYYLLLLPSALHLTTHCIAIQATPCPSPPCTGPDPHVYKHCGLERPYPHFFSSAISKYIHSIKLITTGLAKGQHTGEHVSLGNELLKWGLRCSLIAMSASRAW